MLNKPFYHWPKANVLYPDYAGKSYRLKRLRYRLRSLLHLGYIKKFEHFVNQTPALVRLLNERPNFSYPLVYRFLDKRFSAPTRFALICDNLQFLPQKLEEISVPDSTETNATIQKSKNIEKATALFPLIFSRPINFGDLTGEFELCLMLNDHQAMEGFWTLELRHKPTDREVYLLTFGKLNNALLIAVIQGPNFEGSKEMVKQLTKLCHGLRPAYLMVEVMKMLTALLGYSNLLGIPQRYQNKSRFIKSKRYFVDYDVIFSEAGGIQNHRYWQLPLQCERLLDTIPSKKRSMYRKRYEMLDALNIIMKQKLNLTD